MRRSALVTHRQPSVIGAGEFIRSDGADGVNEEVQAGYARRFAFMMFSARRFDGGLGSRMPGQKDEPDAENIRLW